MLRSIYSLVGFSIWATDGEIGKVKNFYFDDESWKIRYLIVKTGGWLFGRKVLISPVALKTPFWDAESFPVNLSREQVKNSPDIDTDKPVSRQQEHDLNNHYSWPHDDNQDLKHTKDGIHRENASLAGDNALKGIQHEENSIPIHNDPHLRSFKEVVDYKIFASGMKAGRVDDFLVDKNWNIPYMVIETGKWHSGKRILTRTNSIQKIAWRDSSVFIDGELEALRESKEYDYTQLTHHNFERSLNITR
jgi:hypothetical protein